MYRGFILFFGLLLVVIMNQPGILPLSAEHDGFISIVSFNKSRLVLNWTLFNMKIETLPQNMSVEYRAQDVITILPSKLEYDETNYEYVAKRSVRRQDRPDEWKLIFVEPASEACTADYRPDDMILTLTVTLDQVKPEVTKYEIVMKIFDTDKNILKWVRVFIPRLFTAIPPSPPKTEAGNFHIQEPDESERDVTVFWEDDGNYGIELTIQEVQQGNIVEKDMIHLSRGSESRYKCRISLERTYFVLKSYNNMGYSEKSSVIEIPAQNELLPRPSIGPQINYDDNVTAIAWKRPAEDVDVTNFTLYWVDTSSYPTVLRVRGFISLSSTTYIFEAQGDNENLVVGLSVNTPNSSSGIVIPSLGGLHLQGVIMRFDQS